MKTWLTLATAIILGFSFSSCKDDNISNTEPENYEDKLAGTWNLQSVHYETEIPDFGTGNGPTPVSGDGQNVDGTFVLTQDPNNFTYEFSFDANVQGFPLPVDLIGEGAWTTTRDNSKLIVTDSDTGEEIVFNVAVNEENKQVYQTSVVQDVFQGITLTIDLDMEFTR